MEVHFTPEQEAQLAQIAASAGTEAEQVVKNTVLRLLEDETPVPAGAPECRSGISASQARFTGGTSMMMSVEPGIVDANVLVYAVDAEEPHHAASRALLDAAVSELQPCTLPRRFFASFIPS